MGFFASLFCLTASGGSGDTPVTVDTVSWGTVMRVYFGIAMMVLAATPALAQPVPAPLLGIGIPALGVAGGAFIASKIFRRK